MKYPQLNSWLLYKKLDENNYEVKDCRTGSYYKFDINEISFFNQLDGKTDPYSINTSMCELEVRHLLRFLKQKEITRCSRIQKSFLSLNISLFRIKCSKRGRKIAFILNFLLMISFLPVFVFGVSVLFSNAAHLNLDGFGTITGSIFGMIIGLILHEIGHALAAAGYNARLFEVGIIIGLVSGSDGCSVMEELIESESILFNAIDFAFDKKLRSNLIRQGDITSWVKIASSFIGAVCQLAYPLLIIANISGVILCFT